MRWRDGECPLEDSSLKIDRSIVNILSKESEMVEAADRESLGHGGWRACRPVDMGTHIVGDSGLAEIFQ